MRVEYVCVRVEYVCVCACVCVRVRASVEDRYKHYWRERGARLIKSLVIDTYVAVQLAQRVGVGVPLQIERLSELQYVLDIVSRHHEMIVLTVSHDDNFTRMTF